MDSVSILFPDGSTRMIHKGWKYRQKAQFKITAHSDGQSLSPRRAKPSATVKLSGSAPPVQEKRRQREYRFITSGKLERQRDPEVLRVVRSHVRNEFVRDAKERKAITRSNPVEVYPKRNFDSISTALERLKVPCLLIRPTYFSEYPIKLHSHTHALLTSYMTYGSSRIYPVGSSLKSNPLKSPEWFHFAVTDAAMFHAVLYSAAMYVALLDGRSESRDTIYHQTQAISILQKRLNASKQQFDDSTLGAISCLAMGGVSVSSGTSHLSLTSVGNIRKREPVARSYERPKANDPLKRRFFLSK
jgi:Fungal specific transcription factor domain